LRAATTDSLFAHPQSYPSWVHYGRSGDGSLGMSAPMGSHMTVTQARVTVVTAQNSRGRNEDAIGLAGWALQGDSVEPLQITCGVDDDHPLLVAVTDGMGGSPKGDRAARIAAQRLTRHRGPAGATAGGMREAFADADTAIHTAADSRSRGMGCTAAVVAIRSDGLVLAANVGDVRVYGIVEGYAGQLTRDDRVDPANAVVTRCLGGRSHGGVEPHLYEVMAWPGDRFVVCSDGLHDAVAPAVIAGIGSREAVDAARDLLAAALAAGRGDNISLAVIEVVGFRQVGTATDVPAREVTE
jgi:PPM family protein phosphatase